MCELNKLEAEVTGVQDLRQHLGNAERLASLLTFTLTFPPPTLHWPLPTHFDTAKLPEHHDQGDTIKEA